MFEANIRLSQSVLAATTTVSLIIFFKNIHHKQYVISYTIPRLFSFIFKSLIELDNDFAFQGFKSHTEITHVCMSVK